MARLPQPGGDKNAWGHVANEFLSVSHNPDGTIKPQGVQDAVSTQVETALSVQLVPSIADALAEDSTVATAAAAAVDAEPRVSQLIADTDALTTSMATVEPIAERSATQLYDTRAFSTIQDAIDAAHANGGGTVFLGDSELTPQALTLKDGVYLTGRGIGATKLKVNSIVGDGSVTPLPAIATTISRGGRSVNFSSAHGLHPGDVFIISDTTASSFNAARAYYRAGEFCKVRTVESSTLVTLTTPTYDGYAPGGTREVYKLDPIRTGVSNMTIEGSSPDVAISVRFGADLEFSNLRMSGSNNSHLSLSRCYGVNVSRVSVFDNQPAVSLNYGIVIGNSQRIRISDVELETGRHGLATGGGDSIGNVPNRDIIVSDSYINGLSASTGVCGCNLHGNTEFVRFENCTFPAGANPAGDSITYNNCDFGTPPWGSAISCMEMLGTNLTVTNCRFRATDNHLSVRGMLYFYFVETCNRGGIFTFTNNTVDMAGVSGDGTLSIAMYVYLAGALTNTDFGARQMSIKDNYFNVLTATNRRSVRLFTAVGATAWSRILFVDNEHRPDLTHALTDQSTLVYFDGSGAAVPTFAAAPGSRYMRRVNPGTGAGKLYVNQDGGTTWVEK